MDTDKIKDFIVYHFEKGIVAIVMLMSGFLVYSGLGKPMITEKHDPDGLARLATQVKQEVDNDHTTAIVNNEEAPREPAFDIAEEQEKYRNPIKTDGYQLAVLDPSKETKAKQRRVDPVLAKPTGVRTNGVIASLAYRSKDGLYALTDLEPADELEVVEAKPKRSRRKDRRANAMADMDGGYGNEMADMEMEMEMEMMMDMGDAGDVAGADGSAGTRKLAADKNLGLTPQPTQSLANGQEQPPVPGIGWFVAGTAVIPHKEIIDAYQKALSYSEGYDPYKRDLPLYVAYEVQRADITTKSVDQLVDADWIKRDSNTTTIWNAANYWSGFAPEVVPSDYWITGVTMWIPPVVLDPYASFSTHPLIPMKTQRELLAEQAAIEAEKELLNAGPAEQENFTIDLKGGNAQSFGGGGFEGMEMMEMDMEEDYGMDMDVGMSMGGASSGMEGKPAEENPVDYKLLRFYDFAYIKGKRYKVGGKTVTMDPNAPKPGRTYVYRIRYAVNDPNFPELPELQPKGSTLDTDAYARYITLSADAEQNQKRNFKRWSDWSDPSDPTMLPQFDQATFGDVKPNKPRMVKIGSREVEFELDSPKTEVVAESFDAKLGVFVPTLMEATEGTVLAKKVESADVVDPITLEVKKTGEKTIQSSATIIDIEGGAPLNTVDDDEEITQPGLFLMMDGEGRLKVRDAVEEQRLYRIKSFAEERGL